MTAIRYLVWEITKSQTAILLVLMLIFFSQRLVRIVAAAADGDIPASLVLSLLGFGMPAMAQLILPLSLFLGILMALGKLYTESEITAMQACGLGKKTLVISVLILAIITSVVAAVNAIWFGPWSAKHQDKILAEVKSNPSLAAMVEGQFQVYQNGSLVLFIGDISKQQASRFFLAQLRPDGNQRPSIVVADQGKMQERADGSKVILFNSGTRYEGSALLRDFRITDFTDYKAVLSHQKVTIESSDAAHMSMSQLRSGTQPEFLVELHWRLTLIFSVIIMALLVVPLSAVNPRQGRILSMLPAILLYLIFFLTQSTLRSRASAGTFAPLVWMWVVNTAYLTLAIVLNLWDSPAVRKLCARCRRW